jgi:hypothetical protein
MARHHDSIHMRLGNASLDYEKALVCFQNHTLPAAAASSTATATSRGSQFVGKPYQPAAIVEAYRKFM